MKALTHKRAHHRNRAADQRAARPQRTRLTRHLEPENVT